MPEDGHADTDSADINLLRSEIATLKLILIVLGVLFAMVPITYCLRKFAIGVQVVNRIFEIVSNARSQQTDIPVTIDELQMTEVTNIEENEINDSPTEESQLIPVKPEEEIKSVPEASGLLKFEFCFINKQS